jgi:pyrimidine deaminase RibD-like protein
VRTVGGRVAYFFAACKAAIWEDRSGTRATSEVKNLASGFTTASHNSDKSHQCHCSPPGLPDRRTHGHQFVALEIHSSLALYFPHIGSFFFSLLDDEQQHIQYLRDALSEAAKCTPSPTAFCVGCVLVARYPSSNAEQQQQPVVLATGYSRELPGNTHAEANALTKARNLSPEQLSELLLFPTSAGAGCTIDDVLRHTDIYTTLEPCSVRTSGLAPCADALVASKVARCFIGVGEPGDFVQCEGARKLKEAGCQVIWVKGLEEECLAAARRGRRE